MLNELNKSHMGGFENYGADDLYNMEDVWNEKPFKKVIQLENHVDVGICFYLFAFVTNDFHDVAEI